MSLKIFSRVLLMIGFLCLTLVSELSTRENNPDESFQEGVDPAAQAPDISGRYKGTLNYPEVGFSGAATLTVDGNRFTLKGKGFNLVGTLELIQNDGAFVEMKMNVNASPTPIPKKLLSLKLVVGRGGISILTLPDDHRYFYFYTGRRHLEAIPPTSGRDISTNANSVATNANSVNTNANANTFTTNTNSVATNANTATTNANANTVTANTNSPPIVRSVNPRKKIKATEAEPMVSAGPPNANAGPSNSNTNDAEEPSLYDQLKGDANAVFTTPSSMRFEETTDIELLVSPTKSPEDLKSELTERGESGSASTQYSKMMEAQLVGHGFNIAQVGPSIQPVAPGKTTRWKWQIKPKEGGTQRLDLTLNAVLSDGKDRILLQTLNRQIIVKVKLSQRAAGWLSGLKDMQWLWAAIIVPLGTLAVAWWRRKKKRQPTTRKKKKVTP